jgi:hypothetical protein
VSPIVLFLIVLVALGAVLVVVWRYWDNIASVSPEEEEYDERMAALNERQANRLSDDQLRNPLSEDDAWNVMVRRGLRDKRRSRYGRETDRRPLVRRDRYGGDLSRRADERRDRQGEDSRRDERRRAKDSRER